MRYSTEPPDRIFVQNYGFLSFAKNKGKNVGKNISRSSTSKDSLNFLTMMRKISNRFS